MPKHHVIVGGGTAGLNCCTTIREFDGGASRITLVSREAPYSRMALPYYLGREVQEANVVTATAERLRQLKVDALLGRSAARLEPEAHRLTLDDGTMLEYDDLLIATGSSATRPPVPGADGRNIFNQWTLDDTRATMAALDGKGEVVVVGAGFIAFTILNALLAQCSRLTIIEIAPQVLPRMIDRQAAVLVEDWLAKHGVATMTNTRMTSIEDVDGRKRLRLANGGYVDADVIVMATGIRTNLEWLEGSGLKVEQGIVVDDHLRSSAPDVYAAGDVAQGPELITGQTVVHAIEPTAMEHGRVVGANMAGHDRAHPGSLLMNIVDVQGLEIASFGYWDRTEGEITTGLNRARPAYRKYVWDGDQLSGAILLAPSNDVWVTNDLGMLKGLVQSRVHLGKWKEHIKTQPFEVKRPFVASHTTAAMLPRTVLGHPSVPAEAVAV